LKVSHIDVQSVAQAPSAAEIELIEAEAWAELQLNLPREFQQRYGTSVQRRGGAVLLLASKSPTLPINRVIGLGLRAPLRECELDEIIAEYSAAGVERFIVQWSPSAEPSNAPDWFASRGFTLLSRRMAKVYRRADTMCVHQQDPQLVVEEIGPQDAETFERVVAAPLGVPEGLEAGIRSTIGLPGWRFYLVRDGDRPIAGAALYVRGRLAWLGLGATVEGDRRRGAQSALFARRVQDAASDGCEWVSADTLAETTERPSQSFRNMCRAGFATFYERPNFLLDLSAGKAR
jgi:hypothetical protein